MNSVAGPAETACQATIFRKHQAVSLQISSILALN